MLVCSGKRNSPERWRYAPLAFPHCLLAMGLTIRFVRKGNTRVSHF
ncbi:hypothetical protein HMPREF3190_01198 [Umbribacter vaginalis]|nr:hypothetical protein HMPREF3190_01198 [Coriobacteriales bacterium DNF00809]